MNNIRQVAEQAGVSTATVSRAFNTPEMISKQTRIRVLEAADRLNYRPLRARIRRAEASAASVTPSEEGFLGFQFFSTSAQDLIQTNAFYSGVLAGAQSEASAQGMHLLVHATDRHQLTQELPKMIRDQTVAGLLLVGTADPQILAEFLEQVPQIVLVDHRDPTGKHDCIISDGLGGTIAATKYLFELGHRRIGFVMGDTQAPTFRDRLRGFVCAHFEAGMPLDPRLVITANSEEEVDPAIRPILKSADRPTALIAANDRQAFAMVQTCRELGLSVPGDISLIGFDDIEFSAHAWPPLTTLRVNKEQLGRLAVNRLLTRLQAANNSLEEMPPVTVEVPVSLITRQSCRQVF